MDGAGRINLFAPLIAPSIHARRAKASWHGFFFLNSPLIFNQRRLLCRLTKKKAACYLKVHHEDSGSVSSLENTEKLIYVQGDNMKIRPLNDRILVKRLEGEEKTAGGIIIPDSAKEKPAEGEIVAVGPGKLNDAGERVALNVAVGDRVLFSKYGGTDVKLDGEDYLIMREDDILGVVQA